MAGGVKKAPRAFRRAPSSGVSSAIVLPYRDSRTEHMFALDYVRAMQDGHYEAYSGALHPRESRVWRRAISHSSINNSSRISIGDRTRIHSHARVVP